jgi:hypothetical protein
MESFGRLFIAGEHLRNPVGQMEITAMCGGPQGMPLIVMEQHECTTAQDFARVSDESSGNQGLGADREAQSIDVKRRR